MAGFFEFTHFEALGDGNVGGDHVTDMGLRSLQMGREKSESFIPFPTVALPGAHKAEPEKQRHCAEVENETWYSRCNCVK